VNMTILEIMYASFFSIWALSSALWQFDFLREKFPLTALIWKYRLLPIYTFFAPNPGMFDYRIVLRASDASGATGEWSEVDHLIERRWYHFLWNPRKRIQKVIADSISGVKGAINSCEPGDTAAEQRAQIMITPGYMALLNIAASECKKEDKYVQFLVAESCNVSGHRENQPIFRSPMHLVQ